MHARTSRRRGFTILEILIAIVVLVLGITGIIALFPTAIESGNKTIEDSYASAITQSVVDAFTVGLRESRYQYRTGTGPTARTYTYFVFNHDGVVDGPPMSAGSPATQAYADYQNANGPWNLQRKDWCIVLPECAGSEPNTAIQSEPIFLYPTPKVTGTTTWPTTTYFAYPNNNYADQRRSGVLDNPSNQIDNFHTGFFRATNEGVQTPWIPAVFHLGRYREGTPLPTGRSPGDIRNEYRGDAVVVGTGSTETIAADPYPNYSFAFTLQRARLDTCGATANSPPDGKIDPALDAFVSTLYQLRVMVFKNFSEPAAGLLAPSNFVKNPPPYVGPDVVPKNNLPIREFITLISL